MRLSVRESDPGYNHEVTRHCSIFVDGVNVTERCHTADEEEGKAWCFKCNELGQKLVDPDFPDRAAEEVLTGKVLILLNDRMNGDDTYPCH